MSAAQPSLAKQRRGARAREHGRAAELIAALWLMLHGWRLVGFRVRTPQGEVDLLVRRGRVLAVVEVKARATLDEALAAVKPAQRARLLRAGQALAARRGKALSVRLDLVALAPGRRPVHVPDAWGGTTDASMSGERSR